MVSSEPTVKHYSAGEALIDLLAEYGVELIFGIPGTHSIELYRGLGHGKIRHISPRHEQGGGFMADGYARVSGKPGVCLVITGPGVTNLATPLGEAYMASVPLLVISPVNDPDPDDINRGRLHEITNQSAVSAPLTAMSVTAKTVDEIPLLIEKAFTIFTSKRPRPVHISLPLSLITQRVSTPWKRQAPVTIPTVGDACIVQAAQWIKQAKHPIIVAGGGAARANRQLRQLAETVYCPVIMTVAGRGILPAEHALTIGAQLRAPSVQRLLETADLALFIGTELAQTDHWNDTLRLPGKQIWINLCPNVLQHRENALLIRGDSAEVAGKIVRQLPKPNPETIRTVNNLCACARQNVHTDLTEKERAHWAVLSIINEHVDISTTIVSDMTQLAYTAVDYLPMSRPNQWLHPTGYGCLGYALPAAIGAVLADESKGALVIVGDAGLQYTLQEMTLASELTLNIVILLWNNNALQQICDDMDEAGISRIGVFQKNPDFISLAKACHWKAHIVPGAHRLGQALTGAFHECGPVLLMLDDITD